MIERHVYALWVNTDSGSDPFYVGITNNMDRRLGEHKYASKLGTESKYQFIREIEELGLTWDMRLIETIYEDTPRYEDFWIYTLILAGCDLKNEKAGDAKRAAEMDAMNSMREKNLRFNSAKEFLSAREREIDEAEARKKTVALQKKIKTPVVSDHSRTLYAGDFSRDMFISEAVKEFMEKRKNKK